LRLKGFVTSSCSVAVPPKYAGIGGFSTGTVLKNPIYAVPAENLIRTKIGTVVPPEKLTWDDARVGGAFDSASDCNSERKRQIARADRDATLPTKTDAAVAVIESWQHMECVSTDDPRLKEE
jgi:hypothetical protein